MCSAAALDASSMSSTTRLHAPRIADDDDDGGHDQAGGSSVETNALEANDGANSSLNTSSPKAIGVSVVTTRCASMSSDASIELSPLVVVKVANDDVDDDVVDDGGGVVVAAADAFSVDVTSRR